MTKILVRGSSAPPDSEIISSDEFITIAFEQISTISNGLSISTESDKLLEGMSDILELMKSILITKNIKPTELFTVAQQLSLSNGTFSDKKVINNDTDKS